MDCEKFILVREVRFTPLASKTWNFAISGETSPKAAGLQPEGIVFNSSCWVRIQFNTEGIVYILL